MRGVHWVTSVVTVALWGAACVTGTGWSEPAAAAPGPSGGCDFNGDGFEDLAIGVHADNVDGVKKAV